MSDQCRSCGGHGPEGTIDEDENTWRCAACGVWSIYYCPECGDEFEEPCAAHDGMEFERG